MSANISKARVSESKSLIVSSIISHASVSLDAVNSLDGRAMLKPLVEPYFSGR